MTLPQRVIVDQLKADGFSVEAMSKWNELKALAGDEALSERPSRHISCEEYRRAFQLFLEEAQPAAILELITENERNERMLLAACVDMGAIGEALGADMNSDGEELLSMVVDMKAENKRLREFLSGISKTSGDKCAVMGARELLKEFGE